MQPGLSSCTSNLQVSGAAPNAVVPRALLRGRAGQRRQAAPPHPAWALDHGKAALVAGGGHHKEGKRGRRCYNCSASPRASGHEQTRGGGCPTFALLADLLPSGFGVSLCWVVLFWFLFVCFLLTDFYS